MSSYEKLLNNLKKQRQDRGKRNREAGYRFEYAVHKHQERNSLFARMIEGSRGEFDVLSVKANGEIWLISCKTNGYWHPKESERMRKFISKLDKRFKMKIAYYINQKKFRIESFE